MTRKINSAFLHGTVESKNDIKRQNNKTPCLNCISSWYYFEALCYVECVRAEILVETKRP